MQDLPSLAGCQPCPHCVHWQVATRSYMTQLGMTAQSLWWGRGEREGAAGLQARRASRVELNYSGCSVSAKHNAKIRTTHVLPPSSDTQPATHSVQSQAVSWVSQ